MPQSIDESIKQKAFGSQQLRAVINLMYTGNHINALHGRFFKGFGLTSQQYNVLRILRGQQPEPASLGIIQERMLDRMSNASRLVDKLIEKGMATRKPCKHDRRQVDIKITDKGLKLLNEIDGHMHELDAQMGELTDDEAARLNELLDKLRNE